MDNEERMKMPICPVFSMGHRMNPESDLSYNCRCAGEECALYAKSKHPEEKGSCLLREACISLGAVGYIPMAIDNISI